MDKKSHLLIFVMTKTLFTLANCCGRSGIKHFLLLGNDQPHGCLIYFPITSRHNLFNPLRLCPLRSVIVVALKMSDLFLIMGT